MTYALVNDLQMYYEIHGSGRPLVLVHGGLSGIGTSFGAVLPYLAKHSKVIAVELQAHGRTADIDRPLTIAQFAEDVAALLGHLGIDNADFFGYSVGAGVALQVAMAHPELVGKLVLTSVSYRRDGLHPGVLDGIEQIEPEHLAGSPFEQEYASIASNPGDWPTLIAKMKQLDRENPDWPAEAVRAVVAPTLLVFGDSDIIQPEHAVELFRLFGGGVAGDLAGLPRARLAILPGTTHITVMHRAQWLAAMVEEFLTTP